MWEATILGLFGTAKVGGEGLPVSWACNQKRNGDYSRYSDTDLGRRPQSMDLSSNRRGVDLPYCLLTVPDELVLALVGGCLLSLGSGTKQQIRGGRVE